MRVYIAGALSTLPVGTPDHRKPTTIVVDYIANLTMMCKVAGQLRKRGHSPYIPGLDLLVGLVNGDWEEQDYRGLGMAFLEVCDAVLITSESQGVAEEVRRAGILGIPVVYNLEDL